MEIEQKEIKISKGIVVLKKPLAGPRNRAMVIAETPEGIKNTVMMIELLPHCIIKHPFGAVPIKQALDSLGYEEYDLLVDGLTVLMKPKESDVGKKSEKPSG